MKKKIWSILGLLLVFMVILAPAVFAEGEAAAEAAVEALKIDTGDTSFMIISTALVMLMTPGLALFYGGMARTKNVLTTIMQSFICLGVVTLQWVLIGYSLAFGPDINNLIGGLDWVGLSGVGLDPNADYSATIPHVLFMLFQLMFAIITPALISGAIAERVKFPAYVLFVLLWTTLVYDPVAHWVWGVGGWLRLAGVLDFAGGTVVHIISGVSGLVFALMIGKRRGYGTEPMVPHHLPMTMLGAALLWFGWFGFNAGSALGANGLAAIAFGTTHVATAAAVISWMIAEWLYHGKPTILGAVSGAVAGLVSITPAAGFVTIPSAVVIGLVGGVVCFLAVALVKSKLGYDDSLDAFGVHGIGGTWGAIATGFFATTAVNSAGADGFFYGNAAQVMKQLMGVGVSWVFAAVMTFIIVKIIGLFMQITADDEQEIQGMDLTEHGERGYAYQDLISGSPLKFSEALTEEIGLKKTTLAEQ